MSLADLIRGKIPQKAFAAVTVATFATQRQEGARTVAGVSTVNVANTVASEDRARLASWLDAIGERDPLACGELIEACARDAKGLRQVLALAAEHEDRQGRCARFCRHYRRRPPDGAGTCVGSREDLPSVYGVGHPARQLPADLGASCEAFEWEPF